MIACTADPVSGKKWQMAILRSCPSTCAPWILRDSRVGVATGLLLALGRLDMSDRGGSLLGRRIQTQILDQPVDLAGREPQQIFRRDAKVKEGRSCEPRLPGGGSAISTSLVGRSPRIRIHPGELEGSPSPAGWQLGRGFSWFGGASKGRARKAAGRRRAERQAFADRVRSGTNRICTRLSRAAAMRRSIPRLWPS